MSSPGFTNDRVSVSLCQDAGPGSQGGLTLLSNTDKVVISQKTSGFGFGNNKYVVMTPEGAPILYAKENSSALNRMFGGKERSFEINIFDTMHNEVIRLRRPYTFGPDKMDVTVGGRLVSVVRQEMTFLKPVLSVNDAADQPRYRVKGPAIKTGDADYIIQAPNKVALGVIRKRWGGLARELFTDCDNYQLEFPRGLGADWKAALIGTCFLIDFLYYEN